MTATATITLSNAIIEAQSVTDIAKRLANAPTENGADGCDAGEICYWLRQDDGTSIHQGADPFDSLAEAEAGLADVQKNLGWTDLKIVRAEEINGSIHESTEAWGLDAGDLCVMADVSETGVIKISGAAEAESWSDVREAADKIEFVQRLQCGWVNYAGHYQVWAHGNPEPLNYLVAEAAETEADE